MCGQSGAKGRVSLKRNMEYYIIKLLLYCSIQVSFNKGFIILMLPVRPMTCRRRPEGASAGTRWGGFHLCSTASFPPASMTG